MILNLLKKNNVDSSNISFNNFFKNRDNTMLLDTSFSTNCGDIRSMDIFIYCENSSKKVDKYIISLQEKTIGCGKYMKIQEKRFSSPLVWQTTSFEMSQNTCLQFIKNKRSTLGCKIEWDSQFDIVLKPLFDIFFRTVDQISNHYYDRNVKIIENSLIDNNLQNLDIEDLNIQTVKLSSN